MKWLYRLTYLYLLLPFILFCLGWLRLVIALPITALMVWILWKLWMQKFPDFEENNGEYPEILRSILPAIVLTGLWVFLSGVGGYAFQNWDHHWRNAVFRDLISYDWPVVYAAPDRGPIKMLIYYVGHWLLPALVGKLLGWQAANAFLFLWTWLGVLLVVLHLSFKLKTSSLKTLLLLAFFSGMDALGTIFLAKEYPTLWPPLQHLEIWAGDLQYSSFTTQLFWVFNQSVPAWLCIVFIFDDVIARRRLLPTKQSPLKQETPDDEIYPSKRRLLRPQSRYGLEEHPAYSTIGARNDMKFFIWALCFFFAPLASLGLLPYLLLEWFQQMRAAIKNPLQGIRFDLLLTGALIFIVSYLFFSSNTAAQERGFQALALKDVLVFFLLEGGILWLLLAPRLWRDPLWALTGILLFFIPFIQLGSGRDFVMRASIAPLFYLILLTGEALTTKTHRSFREEQRHAGAGRRSLEGTKKEKNLVSWRLGDLVVNSHQTLLFFRIAFFICLTIGALTPLYEINRSIYRTYEYYFLLSDEQRVRPGLEPVTHLQQGGAPEAEHPGSLAADDIQTLAFMDDKLTKNFVANVRQSLYYRYIAPR
jgi:hypothetical protein